MGVMVKEAGIPDSEDAVPGMAFFAGTGPAGKTCGTCAHRGYSRQSQRGTWHDRLQQEVFKSYRTQGCAMFKQLSGHHGPPVETDNKACKYYDPKKNSE